MKKKKKKRSLKQRWVSERLFHNAGTLERIRINLINLANSKSTLHTERYVIEQAINLLNGLSTRNLKSESFRLFSKRSS